MRNIFFLNEGNHDIADKIGVKSLNISIMNDLNINVPKCFTISSDVCNLYLQNNGLSEDIKNEIIEFVKHLEVATGKVFGENLLLSVRSSTLSIIPGISKPLLGISNYKDLFDAIGTMMDSWMSNKACTYRSDVDISDNQGMGVIVQEMLTINKNFINGTIYTRDPYTGDKELCVHFPDANNAFPDKNLELLRAQFHVEVEYLEDVCKTLENHFEDMQEIDFVIGERFLSILQTRTGRRSMKAALKISCDLIDEKNNTLVQQKNSN